MSRVVLLSLCNCGFGPSEVIGTSPAVVNFSLVNNVALPALEGGSASFVSIASSLCDGGC